MPAERPLIVRIRNWVGDVVLSLPALQRLQEEGYALQIVARGAWAPGLLAGEAWPVHVQPAAFGAKLRQLRGLAQAARAADAGFARRENMLLLPASFSSALEARLAGLRAFGVASEGRSALLARQVPMPVEGHELRRTWELVGRFLGRPAEAPDRVRLKLAPAAVVHAGRTLAEQGLEGGFILVCPFAGGKAATANKADKRWPSFPDFVAQAEALFGLPCAVYPGPGEEAEARARYPAARLLRGADLSVYAALLARARLVVANDTGPGHIAAAVGTPLISVQGANDAARWAPWGPQVQVLQDEHMRAQGAQAAGEVHWPPLEAVQDAARQALRQR